MKKTLLMTLLLISGSAYANGEIEGNTQSYTLTDSQRIWVHSLNPNNEPVKTLIQCLSEERIAKDLLSLRQQGGLVLFPGSTLLVKSDLKTPFPDGSTMKAEYTKISCR